MERRLLPSLVVDGRSILDESLYFYQTKCVLFYSTTLFLIVTIAIAERGKDLSVSFSSSTRTLLGVYCFFRKALDTKDTYFA